MQLSSILVVLAPIIATVQAGCYGNGSPIWLPDNVAPYNRPEQICNEGGVSGWFYPGQTKYHCMQLRNNVKAEYWVQWRGQGDRPLGDSDCRDRLRNEVRYCGNGGESVVADWFFRADPNEGWC